MNLAEIVTLRLMQTHRLPDDLLQLIFLLLVKEERENLPHVQRYYSDRSERYIEHYNTPVLLYQNLGWLDQYTEAVSFIFHRLPKLTDGTDFSAPIHELARIGLVECVSLAQASFTALTDSDLLPEQRRYTGNPIDKFLGRSYLRTILNFKLHFSVPASIRFEHTHVVAPTGSGKTQLLQQLILNDLKRDACVIVIDSQSDLINNIKRLAQLPKERLVIVDPTDVEFPVALNIFDIGQHRLKTYSKLDYERHINGVIELLSYVFSSILGAELTQKQGVALNFVLRLMIHIPGATIHTLRNIMAPKGLELYEPYLVNLTESGQAFFRTEFNSKAFEETKTQILRRLYGVLENPTIERLFSHRESRLDIGAEMNAGKVILISTAKDLLKQSGCTFFGRFFINLIAQATLERARQNPSDRKDTYLYIDEVQDYSDPTIATILEQSRKYNVGLTMAHQQLSQLPEDVRSSVFNNTATKFVGGVSMGDARLLAHDLRCEPEYLRDQKKLHFALYARGFLPKALTVHVRAGLMESLPRRSSAEMAELLDMTRDKYSAIPAKTPPPTSPPPQPPSKVDVQDDDIEALNKANQTGSSFIELQRSANGHYYWQGTINGTLIEFFVDTGATRTSLPVNIARDIGLVAYGKIKTNTAGGIVEGKLVRGDLKLEGGMSVPDLEMILLPNLRKPLLGMDILKRLHWMQEGDSLMIFL